MMLLISGLVLFTGVHLLRELGLREQMITRLGLAPYKLLYSLLALAGVVLMVWGKSNSAFVMLYEPRFELQNISNFAMLPAFILVAAGNLPPSQIRVHAGHPMLLGVVVWAAAHLWANGDLSSVVLFGGVGLWALVKFVIMTQRLSGPGRASLVWDAAAIILGSMLYALFAVFHGELFGVGPRFN